MQLSGGGYDPCNHKYKVERIVNCSGEIEVFILGQ